MIRCYLRQWLPRDYKILIRDFPSPTRYVCGISIITFEGLVTHIERARYSYPLLSQMRCIMSGLLIGSQKV